ncbi:MAG: pre-peptidase C-terminal domain-containing protein [Caulobacterales bacterium]
MRIVHRLACTLAAALLFALPAAAQTPAQVGRDINGALARGDRTLSAGEYMDEFTITGRAGQQVSVRMNSSQFDTYVFIRGPNGFAEDNDDAPGGGTNSALEVTLPADGTYQIVATSFSGGEQGNYTFRIDQQTAGAATPQSPMAATGSTRAPTALTVGRSVNGTLAQGDAQLSSGEFVDVYTLQGRSGQRIELTMTSRAIDPYLMIAGPDGYAEYNDDDAEAGDRNARLVLTLPASGAYRIQATSYAAGERGAYQLAVRDATNAPQAAADIGNRAGNGSIGLGQSRTAALGSGDATLSSGEFADSYAFEGRAGQSIQIDARSTDFDAYVMLIGPSGNQEENDDAASGVTDARLETQLGETGTYEIVVTSYRAGETGGYQLSVNASEAGRSTAVAAAPRTNPGTGGSAAPPTRPTPTGGSRLTPNAPIQASLAASDQRLSSGEFVDRFTFMGRRGQRATLEMRSGQIDSYLMVTAPSGDQQDNDDANANTRDANLNFVLREDGEYQVSATSYSPGEVGAYTLRMALGETGPAANAARGGGRIFAVMVGISDYGNRANNLEFTADDAVKLSETLERRGVLGEGSVVLTEAQATRAAVRAAITRVAALAGPDDAFLFFFSGHGDQQATAQSATEPDGLNESIVLRDGAITDDEMAQLFANVRARVSILAVDACFSGGFARDVVSRPAVMGLFSSEEDLTSAVAEKFRAGGYLSHFLRNGLGGDADDDGDAIITAGELSAFLRNRFATEVQNEQAETRDGQRNYQYLVVDRGGVKIDDMLVALR